MVKNDTTDRLLTLELTIKNIMEKLNSNSEMIYKIPDMIKTHITDAIEEHEKNEQLMYKNLMEKIEKLEQRSAQNRDRIQGLEIFKIKFIAIATTIMVVGQFLLHLLNKFL